MAVKQSNSSLEAMEIRSRWLKLCDECGGKGTYYANECGPDFQGAELVACHKCQGKRYIMVEGWAVMDSSVCGLVIRGKEEDSNLPVSD